MDQCLDHRMKFRWIMPNCYLSIVVPFLFWDEVCAISLNVSFILRSDPFLEFAKVSENGDFSVVHRTEVIKFTLNPEWRPFTIAVRTLCGGDMDRSIKVTCFDWNRSGNHSLIGMCPLLCVAWNFSGGCVFNLRNLTPGQFYTTLRQLSGGPGPQNVYQVINPNKKVLFKYCIYLSAFCCLGLCFVNFIINVKSSKKSQLCTKIQERYH